MPADSTWGIAKPVRSILAARITELRVGLQEDARRQLAALGITAERTTDPPGGRTLSFDEARTRSVVLAVLDARRESGVPRVDALQSYVEEVAFTLLDRLVTFRCLEERDLLVVDGQTETLVRKERIRGTSSLVWRTRDANPGLDERSVARLSYRRACAAMTARVRVLFDPDDEPSAIFPTLPLWQRAIDAFNDPAIPPETFAQDEIMGWVYQYWSTELKNAVYDKLAKGGKIEDPSELAAATALYTERYIVDYLVQNTLGATWVEMHPESTLPATWPYYVTPPAGNPPVEREPKRVRDITLIDPCVGSGHFLVRAFDLFAQLYNDEGIEKPEDIPGLILERNLYGADIDRRAVQIAALALYVKGCALAGADFRPKKLNLVACDIAIPPTPPEDFIDSLDEPELKELAKSLWSGLAGIRTFGSLLHPERAVNDAFAKLKAKSKGSLWETDTDWARKRAQFVTGLRKAFTSAAGDTDLSTRLFGEEASRGLDALQILGRRYDVVVTNPPYAGRGNLTRDVRAYVDKQYAEGSADLSAAFVLRSRELSVTGGFVGMVTQQSWMFLGSYAALRKAVLEETTLISLGHLGEHAFEEAAAAGAFVVAFCLVNLPPGPGTQLTGMKLVGLRTPALKAASMRRLDAAARLAPLFTVRQDQIHHLPGMPIAYWLSDKLLAQFVTRGALGSVADIKVGLQTSDNDRFVRNFWEITRGMLTTTDYRWQRLAKAGRYQKWVGLESSVVDWARDGEAIKGFRDANGRLLSRPQNTDYYFREGITYSVMARGSLGSRWLRHAIFGDVSPSIFPKVRTGDAESLVEGLLPLLCSRLASYLLRVLTQEVKFREGYVARLPLPPESWAPTRALTRSAIRLKERDVDRDSTERAFAVTRSEARAGFVAREPEGSLPLLHALEGWNERLVFDAYELGPEDVQAVIDETGIPAGWNALIAGYDLVPDAPSGIEIPDGLTEFLATLEHRQLSAAELGKTKARLRTLYEAGPGAKVEDAEPAAKGDGEEEGAALGARIPIPTETFLEELAAKTELHPITVHWLLEELKVEGVVSPPLRKAELEEYVDISLVRMLGYRWPEQDTYEAEHGPILDPDLVDGDGIIPLVPCGDEPIAEERVHTRLVRQLGDDGADAFLADLRRYTKRDLADWIRRDFFKAHTKRFKNRPIAWHLRSPEGAFEALVLYHRLSKDTLTRVRVTYAGDRLARLRADQQRARDRGDGRAITDLQVQIEDVEAFRQTLAAIEQGTDLKHRIRCRWKDETDKGRPGPYAIDIDDGVKVNIRPFQESGLLPAKVISKW